MNDENKILDGEVAGEVPRPATTDSEQEEREEIKYEMTVRSKERGRELSIKEIDIIREDTNTSVFTTKYQISLSERGKRILTYEDLNRQRARKIAESLLEEARGWF